ncbi:PTS sugar transporter subunit IIC [Mesoplasma syrphidae]|uniref:PTS sugar transporter subunit IIC n=1 Tax=Mesoplasma syrphidae TaxID=225999 RepID=A0A2K9C884_9MOLU|nr:PTS transporter subunit EIIC [Mesoplasma syrphidae]AUF83215.1 PTS sugar transporter subunit IIC [Mesoplasma syrphidae]
MKKAQIIKNKIFSAQSSLESFARAILIPISIIPLLALIGAMGYAVQAIAVSAGTYSGNTKIAADAIKNIGMIAITNIDFLVAVGLAAGLAKEEKIAAALSGLMALAALYVSGNMIMSIVSPKMLVGNGPKENGLITRFGVIGFQYSALGGMTAGMLGYGVHRWTYKLKFPTYLAFFGGPRFSPVAATLVAWLFGMPLALTWIPISGAIKSFGEGLTSMGVAAPFIYGSFIRMLIPFGLHHVLNYFLYYTEVGDTWVNPQTNETIKGIYSIAIAKIGAGEFVTAKSSWIINGTFPTNMFSLTGAGFGMWICIPKENRKVGGSIIFSAMLSSFLSGITEPIEFTFLFSAPILYVIHIIFTGCTYMFMYIGNFAQVSTRGSGLITWIIVNGINFKNIERVWGIFIIGPMMFAIYTTTFVVLIKKLRLRTPGVNGTEIKLHSKKDFKEKINPELNFVKMNDDQELNLIVTIIEGFGGKENILVLANCVSRLRVTVANEKLVDENILNSTGNFGIKKMQNKYQVIYGPKVINIATELKKYLKMEE